MNAPHPRISGDGRYRRLRDRGRRSRRTRRGPTSRCAIASRGRHAYVTCRRAAAVTSSAGAATPISATTGWSMAFSSAATTLTARAGRNGASEDIYADSLAGAHDHPRQRAACRARNYRRGDSILPSLSADGRWLAFASTAALAGESGGTSNEKRPRPCDKCTCATLSVAGSRSVSRAHGRRAAKR